MLILESPWTRQPQQHAPLSGPLSQGLIHSLDGGLALVNGRPYSATITAMDGSAAASLQARYNALGRHTTGSSNENAAIRADGPLAANAPWAFAFTHVPTGNVSLSHAFGFGLTPDGSTGILSDASEAGKYRGCLNYLNNYYFWGSSADWNTSIPWDTDSIVHTVMFSHDGTNIYFWRDGVMRASVARPVGIVATPANKYVVMGSRHTSAASAASSTFLTGRVWNRYIPPAEAKLYTLNPWCVYAPRRIPIPTPAAAGYTHPTLSLATATEIGATSFKPSVTYTFA